MNVKKILRSRKNNLLTFQELEVFWHLDPSEDPSFIIVHFDGKMSERNTYELNQKFYKIIENCSINAMILNLSKLSYINSMGIAILYSLTARFRENGGNTVIGGVHPFVRNILTLADILPDIKVFDTQDEAKNYRLWQYHL